MAYFAFVQEGDFMIKVVIADDEARICQLIKVLVDWDALGMEIAGIASNGIEALMMVRKERQDILITDIRMPGASGIDLIKQARSICPSICMIIISGYAHFEYAKTALAYGVKDYLLKPINQKELMASLQKVAAEIRLEQEQKEADASLAEERTNDRKRLRNVLIQDLLSGQVKASTEEEMEAQYHFSAKNGVCQAFALRLDHEAKEEKDRPEELVWKRTEKIIKSGLERFSEEWILYWHDCFLYGVMNYDARQVEEVRKMMRDCLNQLEAAKHLIGVRVFSLGLGGSKKTSPELQASMEEALLAVQERFLCGSGILLENIEHTPVLYEQRLLDKYTRRIGHALEILNIEEMKQAVHELFQAAVDTPNVHGFELFELVCAAGNIFVMQLDVKEKEKLMKNLKENCDAASNAEELFQKLEQFEEAQILEILKVREADSARPVRKAKCYIKNHYGEQITLEEVSAEVGLSTAYFSVLFKKETEVGFAKYLMNVRMEQAKTLLRETNLPVAGICKKVGYNDLKHFTHTFEKLAGVKPAVYRKLYG